VFQWSCFSGRVALLVFQCSSCTARVTVFVLHGSCFSGRVAPLVFQCSSCTARVSVLVLHCSCFSARVALLVFQCSCCTARVSVLVLHVPPSSRVVLQKDTVALFHRNSRSVAPCGSLPCLQELITGPHPNTCHPIIRFAFVLSTHPLRYFNRFVFPSCFFKHITY